MIDLKPGMTKKNAIAIMERLLINVPSQEMKAVCEIAIKTIGQCPSCRGTGETVSITQPNGPHKIRNYVRATHFITNCKTCDGTGQKLKVTCRSCGVTEDLTWDYKSIEYCKKCAETQKKKGTII